MKVRCWGSRGNIPASGMDKNFYGGATACLEVRTSDHSVIILDAGSGIRKLGQALLEANEHSYTLLVSHGHDDHLIGLPFFEPLYDEKTKLLVFEHEELRNRLEGMCFQEEAQLFSPMCARPLTASIAWEPALQYGQVIQIGSAFASAIPASHPGRCSGFKITDRGKSIVYLPDNELDFDHGAEMNFDEYVNSCRGVDLLVHDAQFTCDEYENCKGWGHSTWRRALDLAVAANVQQLGLFHHDVERTDEQLDAIVKQCRREAATRSPRLLCFAMREGTELVLR